MFLRGRDFLTFRDYTKEEIEYLIELAVQLKAEQKSGQLQPLLAGKTLAMIFRKASTRTRVSFEVAMYQLGGLGLFFNTQDLQIGRGESIKDTARVLASYVDAILIRTYQQDEVEGLARYSKVPVINGLTDLYHPTQALADFVTIFEHKQKLAGLKLAYLGDGNNMVHSLMIGGAKLGLEIRVATPKGFEPDQEIINLSQQLASEQGGKVVLTNSVEEAITDADILYTDVWASMGQEEQAIEKKKHFHDYQINKKALMLANRDALVMHCLPAYRGEEITDEVIEGPQSVIFEEAENRLHAHRAILAALV